MIRKAGSDADDVFADPLFAADSDFRYTGLAWGVYGFRLELQGREPRTHALVLPPQSLSQSEPSATVIQPTQEGGTWVERNGVHVKEIILSGVTGFLPRRGMVKVPTRGAIAIHDSPFTDAAIKHRVLSPASGYTEFHTLRSLYREYQNVHRFGTKEEREAAQLFFFNGKDNETWLVEWLDFKLERNSHRPLLYTYTIHLSTLRPGGAIALPPDESAFNANPTASSLTALATRITNAVQFVSGFVNSGLSIARDINSALSTLVSTGSVVASELNTIVAGGSEMLNFPRSLLQQSVTVGAQLDEALANATIGVPLAVYQAAIDLQMEFTHLDAVGEDLFAKPWTSRADKLFGKSSINEVANTLYGASGDASDQSDAGGGNGDIGTSSSGLGGGGSRNGAREDTPQAGESIQDFALRVCGDTTMWVIIAEMNGLQFPYFSQSQQHRAPHTLAPGDTCIYPVRSGGILNLRPAEKDKTFTDESVSAVNTATTVQRRSIGRWRVNEWVGYTVKLVEGWGAGQERLVVSNTTNTLTVDIAWDAVPNDTSVFTIFKPSYTRTASHEEQSNFGRDILVKKQRDGTWDAVKSIDGDLATVAGVPNVSQAVELKFDVLKGQLPMHPLYGAGEVVGGRGTPERLISRRLIVEQTLLSDTRLRAVRELSVVFQNGVETVTATLEYVDGRRVSYASSLR